MADEREQQLKTVATVVYALQAFGFFVGITWIVAVIIDYVKKDDASTSYASRTMMWSGPIVAAFVIFHVLHLTVGAVVPIQEIGPNEPNVRANVIAGFQNPAISGFYILAMILLCMHLYHGLWSMFQSLGFSHPRYTPKLKTGAALFAILIAIGNCSIPIAVLAGLVK